MPKIWTEGRLQNFIASEIEESLTLEYKAAEALEKLTAQDHTDVEAARQLVGLLDPAKDAARLRTAATDFQMSAADATARAFKDMTGTAISGRSLVSTGTQADYTQMAFEPGVASVMPHALSNPIRVKKVYFTLPDGLQPAYYLELNVGTKSKNDSDYYSYVVSATDGTVLFRNNLTADAAFTYRVWAGDDGIPWDGPQGAAFSPHPDGLRSGLQVQAVPQQVITLEHGPISTQDPWLAPGATESKGNNVDAYADLASPDGFGTGDTRAQVTSANTFDFLYDLSVGRSDVRPDFAMGYHAAISATSLPPAEGNVGAGTGAT